MAEESTSTFGSLLDRGGDLLISGIDRYIDRETRQDQVVVVNDPAQVKTTENTGAAGVPDTYKAGEVQTAPQVLGMPWHQALLIGSVGLLGLGIAAKLIMR